MRHISMSIKERAMLDSLRKKSDFDPIVLFGPPTAYFEHKHGRGTPATHALARDDRAFTDEELDKWSDKLLRKLCAAYEEPVVVWRAAPRLEHCEEIKRSKPKGGDIPETWQMYCRVTIIERADLPITIGSEYSITQ